MYLEAINHLAFITPDIEQTIRFYRHLLGMELNMGIGHGGYRHYFFRTANNYIAFFEYDGAKAMERKFHGERTENPLGFDHVAITVDSKEDLSALKDRLEAGGMEVHGAVDHGFGWSIYFFDNNNIPLEATWECLDITRTPAIEDEEPLAIAEEGASPQPGIWPEVTNPTPPEKMTAHPGNGFAMRARFLREGWARPKAGLADAAD